MFKIPKDALWKGILEELFAEFLWYFFPDWAGKEVDFGKDFEFLDKELAEIVPESQEKKRYADKLVKVFTKNGGVQWCLVHVEIQGYEDLEFAKRMYQYYKRIEERYDQNIVAIAIYTEANPTYHPQMYHKKFLNTELTFKFNTFKILEKTEQALDVPNNPFSIVMLTAYKALQKGMLKDKAQIEWKLSLVRKYYEAGYSKEKTRKIIEFISHYVSFQNNYPPLFQKENTWELKKKSWQRLHAK
ncbi:MAG: hypothetical protein EAZ97_00035 [Bacteroidetes bacterium]|nr:MAG: hypothetical protein EAZ97_00035 [Bacteroidota bacterium]